MEEIWKPVIGWEGFYEVSNLGNVRRVTGRILKQQKIARGYMGVTLSDYKDRRKSRRYVHQLVAEVFIGNPERLHDINHKNEIKDDNRVENLEYCSRVYNSNYGTIAKRKREKMYENTKHRFPDVLQYDINGNLIATYSTAGEASRATGFSQFSICRCCRGERKTYKNYIWKYKTH